MHDVVELLSIHARERPDHLAVVDGPVSIGYGAFFDRVRRLAAALAVHGPHPKVLILLPQGIDAYAAMFATLMVGGYYAPVNIAAPAAKQRLVVCQFDPDVILGTAALLAALEGDDEPLPGTLIDPATIHEHTLLAEIRPAHDLAYVIFTSGSTGIPKGVMVPRHGLAHYVDWALAAMSVTPNDRWSQHPNIAFDLSVLDIYGALCGGATLYPLTGALHRLMPARAITDFALTIWNSVPSVVSLMMRAGQVTQSALKTLRLMTFCGEPLLPEHLDAIFAVRPDLVVHNTYGPTEATVSCTLVPLTIADYAESCGSTVAIGDAIPGMAIHLVDGLSADEGELVITGPQLARGYWNDPQTTAKAFRRLTVDGVDMPAYFTGDWAKRIGRHVFFVSRRDFQVKIMGYRVELEEINAAMRKCGILAVAALIDHALHAFVETAVAVDGDTLRAHLAEFLEPHAIPTHFHAVAHLPRNANDKIDVLALIAAHKA